MRRKRAFIPSHGLKKRPLSHFLSPFPFFRRKRKEPSRGESKCARKIDVPKLGLITREPIGFLLDLVRFHQRSNHFSQSIISLSLYLVWRFFTSVFGPNSCQRNQKNQGGGGEPIPAEKKEKIHIKREHLLLQKNYYYYYYYYYNTTTTTFTTSIAFIHPLLDHV